jgi:cytidylate kinase
MLWTISAEDGTAGDEVARALADAAEVPLCDRGGFAELAKTLELMLPDLDGLEERFCGRSSLALMLATSAGAPEALSEIRLRNDLPTLGRQLLREAARCSCVIYSGAAFAILNDRPGAIHARIHAPFEWRLDAYRRERLLNRHQAEKELKHLDHLQHSWVRMLYHANTNDLSRYSLALDASQIPTSCLVETLLALGHGHSAERGGGSMGHVVGTHP